MASRSGTRKDAVRPSVPAPIRAAEAKTFANILSFIERHSVIFVLALLLLGTIRIVSTYSVFSYTYDEPAHIACGMEWLDKGVYTWEVQHPPLARVAAALGPYLIGVRSQNTPRTGVGPMIYEGLGILFNGGRSDEVMGLARLGILPFYLVGCLAVYFWTRRYASRATAVIALFFFSFLPTVLAHGGLATTDMACTAFLALAFFAAVVWMEEPGTRSGTFFGLAGGLAVVSKFSVLPYFAAAAAFGFLWYWRAERPKLNFAFETRRRLASLAIAAGVAFFVIWAMYRFSFGKVYFADMRLPAPELFAGIRDVLHHNAKGHPGFLLGQRSSSGFWSFYPVDLVVKSPIPLLVTFFLGAAIWKNTAILRRAYLPLAFSAGVLAVALFSHINIGIRHVMPLYSGVCITAAAGLTYAIESSAVRRWMGWAALALAVWYGGSSLASHPDYLAYFNQFAGSHPENIVVDSDLDWGQDMKRLAARLREVGARQVYFASADLGSLEQQYGLPHIIDRIDTMSPSPGWNAVSLTILKEHRLGLVDRYPNLLPWPERTEGGEMIGKSIRLYYFPGQ